MTTEQKKLRIIEIDKMIEALKEERMQLNPYANLKDLSNKSFGEGWSEPFICSKCPSFEQKDQKGWDLWSSALGRVEVKSTRLPCTSITFNQCHPYDCDYFLFVEYDTINITEHIFLVPSKDFFLFSTGTRGFSPTFVLRSNANGVRKSGGSHRGARSPGTRRDSFP